MKDWLIINHMSLRQRPKTLSQENMDSSYKWFCPYRFWKISSKWKPLNMQILNTFSISIRLKIRKGQKIRYAEQDI